jgi:hypothetical protein
MRFTSRHGGGGEVAGFIGGTAVFACLRLWLRARRPPLMPIVDLASTPSGLVDFDGSINVPADERKHGSYYFSIRVGYRTDI